MSIESISPISSSGATAPTAPTGGATGQTPGALTEEEQDQVRQLKARDAEVRQHEQAHVNVGGPYVTGGPSYDYQTGPDGQRYAIGGEVELDISPVPDDPEATIEKAQTVHRAALAPAEPSGQDYRVAAQAKQLESEARQELAEQQTEETAIYGPTGTASVVPISAFINEEA